MNNEFRACVVQAPHHELLPEEADVLVPVGLSKYAGRQCNLTRSPGVEREQLPTEKWYRT